jgi:zinc transport system substrate-binding protein
LPTLRLTSVLCAAALLGACGGSSSDGSEDTGHGASVVAAFYPLAYAAEQIGGRSIQVKNLTPADAEPHDVELSPRDVGRIRSADIVLYLDRGFQPAVEAAIEGAGGRVIDLLDGLPLRPGADAQQLSADPHVWLDPVLYTRMTHRIGATFGNPGAARAFAGRLRALDEEYRRGLSRCARRDVVTSHAAFGYLAERYRLRQIPITGLTPEAEPTPRDLTRIVHEVRARGATTIFFETLVSPDLARTVARETGAKTAVLDPLEGLTKDELAEGENYFSVMRANLQALRQALGCR